MKNIICNECKEINELINGPYCGRYLENINLLKEKMTLYAGNALFENLKKHLDVQDRYALEHYFKCERCNRFYFIGICFYGSYKFEEKDSKQIEMIDFNNRFNGNDKIGLYFTK